MKVLSRPRLLVIYVITILILAVLPSSAAGTSPFDDPAQNNSVYTYWVGNVVTREDRTAIVQTGADIVEIGAEYGIIRAQV